MRPFHSARRFPLCQRDGSATALVPHAPEVAQAHPRFGPFILDAERITDQNLL
jgi:hypothetical protein